MIQQAQLLTRVECIVDVTIENPDLTIAEAISRLQLQGCDVLAVDEQTRTIKVRFYDSDLED